MRNRREVRNLPPGFRLIPLGPAIDYWTWIEYKVNCEAARKRGEPLPECPFEAEVRRQHKERQRASETYRWLEAARR